MFVLPDDLRQRLELARLVREESCAWQQDEPQLAHRLRKLALLVSEMALALRDLDDMGRDDR